MGLQEVTDVVDISKIKDVQAACKNNNYKNIEWVLTTIIRNNGKKLGKIKQGVCIVANMVLGFGEKAEKKLSNDSNSQNKSFLAALITGCKANLLNINKKISFDSAGEPYFKSDPKTELKNIFDVFINARGPVYECGVECAKDVIDIGDTSLKLLHGEILKVFEKSLKGLASIRYKLDVAKNNAQARSLVSLYRTDIDDYVGCLKNVLATIDNIPTVYGNYFSFDKDCMLLETYKGFLGAISRAFSGINIKMSAREVKTFLTKETEDVQRVMAGTDLKGIVTSVGRYPSQITGKIHEFVGDVGKKVDKVVELFKEIYNAESREAFTEIEKKEKAMIEALDAISCGGTGNGNIIAEKFTKNGIGINQGFKAPIDSYIENVKNAMEDAMGLLKNIHGDKWESEWKIKFREVSFAGENYADITEKWPNSVKKMIGSLNGCGAAVEKDVEKYLSKLQKCCKSVEKFLTKLGL